MSPTFLGRRIVDEDRLAWEQVQEFRRDARAHSAYRMFVHWLDGEMVGKPATFVADEIAARLERYDWALRKHGIETVTGALERTIQPGLLAGASAVGASLQFITTQPVWSLLAAGSFVVGGACLSLAKVLLARKDVELAHREIAYVQHAKEILTDKKGRASKREPANSAAPADQKAPLPGR